MGRIHLFEFEDQDWFPAFLRDYGTDFLQFLSNFTNMFHPIIHVYNFFGSLVWWDGIVSSLRTYSEEEMNDLINELKNKNDFSWEVGRIRSGRGYILYLLGVVKKIERPVLAEPELMLTSVEY